ncbi:MAG TPA: hypothetical protein PKC27_04715, partial [Methanomethylovorans sp.]|nr:hypothetical protein [Methanomethylovorans sp.]
RGTGDNREMCYIGMSLKEPYKNLSAADVDEKYLQLHETKHSSFFESDIDKSKNDIDKPQIKNLINQYQKNELPKNGIDNSTIFNDNFQETIGIENVLVNNIANNVELSMPSMPKAALTDESDKSHLWFIYGVTEHDSVLSMVPSMPQKINELLDLWEMRNSKIFAGNKVRALFDIPKYSDARGIDHTLIFEAVEKRSKGRCLDCGVDTQLNEEIGKGYRCKPCHDRYSNPPPVKIPDEFSLEEPAEAVQ